MANRWNHLVGLAVRYPDTPADFLARCHEAGQVKPTPLLLQYGKDDYNCLHQDLYGEHVFPLQITILLSAPDHDFPGGEFVMTEQRPRKQSRPIVGATSTGGCGPVCRATSSRARRARLLSSYSAPRRQPNPIRPSLYGWRHFSRCPVSLSTDDEDLFDRPGEVEVATVEYGWISHGPSGPMVHLHRWWCASTRKTQPMVRSETHRHLSR